MQLKQIYIGYELTKDQLPSEAQRVALRAAGDAARSWMQHDVETGARQKFAASAVPGVGQEAATGTVAVPAASPTGKRNDGEVWR